MLFSTLFATVGLLAGLNVNAAPLSPAHTLSRRDNQGKITFYDTQSDAENEGWGGKGACREYLITSKWM